MSSDARRFPPEVLAEMPPRSTTPQPVAVAEPKWTEEQIEAACAWSDFRRDYGVSADEDVRRLEYRAFLAGFTAGRNGDQSGPLR